jgi:hypothetical protein
MAVNTGSLPVWLVTILAHGADSEIGAVGGRRDSPRARASEGRHIGYRAVPVDLNRNMFSLFHHFTQLAYADERKKPVSFEKNIFPSYNIALEYIIIKILILFISGTWQM